MFQSEEFWAIYHKTHSSADIGEGGYVGMGNREGIQYD